MTSWLEVILPCLDEAAALPWVLERIPDGVSAIVVDNGSADGSPDIARSFGARVIDCTARGYGAACHAGLEAATAEYVAFCDCDASLDPADAVAAADLVRRGEADLVVARRRPTTRQAWPLPARVANLELARRFRRRTSVPLRDLGPIRAARREALIALPILDRRSGYPLETVLRAAQADWRIAPLDVAYLPRAGRSKVTGTVRGTVTAVRDMSAVLQT